MSSESPEKNKSEKTKEESDESRRNVLKLGLGLGAVFVVGGIGAVAKTLISPGSQPTNPTTTTQSTTGASSTSQTSSSLPPPSSPGFPVIKVGNVNDLKVNSPLSFNYPLEETPNFLVKLGVASEGGVGPDGDIVAFSAICQHLGCIWGYVDSGASPKCDATYKATTPVGYCCCHGSAYELDNGAKVISGPAPRPVPQVILNFDSATGNIYATGMTPPTIFGFDTGSNDVSHDLQGGTVVG